MALWSQRKPGVVYPAWWEDREKLLARRLREMNWGRVLTEADGLPEGMTVKKDTAAFHVWVDGEHVWRQQFEKRVEDAATRLAKWIEAFREESENMAISENGVKLLRAVAVTDGIPRDELDGRTLAAVLKRDPALVWIDMDGVRLTDAGRELLASLPDFDQPIGAPKVVEPPSQVEEMGSRLAEAVAQAKMSIDEATQRFVNRFPAAEWRSGLDMSAEDDDESARAAAAAVDELVAALGTAEPGDDEPMVRLVLAEGVELADLVNHCGAEFREYGGVQITLEVMPGLLYALYPPLRELVDGLRAVGADVQAFGDLRISVEKAESL